MTPPKLPWGSLDEETFLPLGAFERQERARDCGEASNINWRIPDKFQWSRQMILATPKVSWKGLHLMKEHVLKYPLSVELHKSIIGGKHAIVWSKKQWECDTTETAMGLTWWRDSVLLECLKARRLRGGFEYLLYNNWRIPDKKDLRKWQTILATSQQVPEYPLCIELPRSILEKPWKMKEQKSVSETRKQVISCKLPWGLTWWRLVKRLFCP